MTVRYSQWGSQGDQTVITVRLKHLLPWRHDISTCGMHVAHLEKNLIVLHCSNLSCEWLAKGYLPHLGVGLHQILSNLPNIFGGRPDGRKQISTGEGTSLSGMKGKYLFLLSPHSHLQEREREMSFPDYKAT